MSITVCSCLSSNPPHKNVSSNKGSGFCLFKNFLLGLFNPKHPEQCPANSGHSVDICWRTGRKERGEKRLDVVMQRQSSSLTEGIPEIRERSLVWKLESFLTHLKFLRDRTLLFLHHNPDFYSLRFITCQISDRKHFVPRKRNHPGYIK